MHYFLYMFASLFLIMGTMIVVYLDTVGGILAIAAGIAFLISGIVTQRDARKTQTLLEIYLQETEEELGKFDDPHVVDD